MVRDIRALRRALREPIADGSWLVPCLSNYRLSLQRKLKARGIDHKPIVEKERAEAREQMAKPMGQRSRGDLRNEKTIRSPRDDRPPTIIE